MICFGGKPWKTNRILTKKFYDSYIVIWKPTTRRLGFSGLTTWMTYGLLPWQNGNQKGDSMGFRQIPWQSHGSWWAVLKDQVFCEENSLEKRLAKWQLFWVHGKVHSLAAMNSSTSMSIPRIDQRKYLQVNLQIHFHRKKTLFFFFSGVCLKNDIF